MQAWAFKLVVKLLQDTDVLSRLDVSVSASEAEAVAQQLRELVDGGETRLRIPRFQNLDTDSAQFAQPNGPAAWVMLPLGVIVQLARIHRDSLEALNLRGVGLETTAQRLKDLSELRR